MKKRTIAIIAAALAGVATNSYALNFNTFDTNVDGKITQDEFVAFWTAEFDRCDAKKDGDLVIADGEAIGIERWDENINGRVSLEEYLKWRKHHFNCYDSNQDGILTPNEYKP